MLVILPCSGHACRLRCPKQSSGESCVVRIWLLLASDWLTAGKSGLWPVTDTCWLSRQVHAGIHAGLVGT